MAEPAEPSQSSAGRRTPGPWLWVLAGLTFVAGVVGYWQYLTPGTPQGTSGWNLLYYSLQLFTLNFTEADGDVPVPPLLHVVRVLAPAVTVLAASLAIVGEEVGLWTRRHLRRGGYSLVVGDTAEARSVARALRDGGHGRVYPVVDGHLRALHRAGIRRAGVVYVVGEDTGAGLPNVGSALGAATSLLSQTRVFVHVKDSELALGLRARDLMTERTQALEYFMMDELAARAHVESDELGPDARPEILVVGAGAFGRAVVVAFARCWRVAFGPGDTRIAVTLVDRNASAARAQLRDRWRVVEETCDITAIDTEDVAAALRVVRPPYRAYICHDDEQVALRVALTAEPLWHGGPGSLVVRLNELSEHAAAFPAGPFFDNLERRLVVANVSQLAGPYVAAQPDLFADLGRAIHARFLADEQAKGRALGSSPTLVPWAQLPASFRAANVAQARDLPGKLRLVHATIAPRSAANPVFAFTPDEVERLAVEEHERWMRERTAAGWKYAATTDRNRKRHSDLVEWPQLNPAAQQKDRDAVRGIETTFADALADIGLQIVRLAPGT